MIRVMKHYKSFIIAATVVALASCADDNYKSFSTVAPEKGQEYAYLNDYDNLKEYVNKSVSPNFKLGGATDASEFNSKKLVYALDVANFDELVTGNDFKFASCVAEDGTMSFNTVSEFVNNATEAGLSVYGHTLAWHSQQQPKYLNNIISGREIIIDEDEEVEKIVHECDFSTMTSYSMWGSSQATERMSFSDGMLVITNTEPTANFWDLQYFVDNDIALEANKEYILRVEMKGSSEGAVHYVIGPWGTDIKTGSIGFTTDLEVIETSFKPTEKADGVHILFQSGDYVGTYGISKVQLITKEAPGPAAWWVNLLTNSDMEGEENVNFIAKDGDGGGAAVEATILDGVGVDGSRGIKVHAIDNPANAWDTQFWIYTPNHEWAEGEKYQVKMKVRADKPAKMSTQAHEKAGNYIFYSMLGDINVTTEWQEIVKEGQITASQATNGSINMHSIAFNLNELKEENNYYFDDIEWSIEESGSKIPLTDEEKKDTLIWVLDKWISGMMEACDGKVKAWDVINEAVSGGNPDKEGVYALQHDNGDASNFFWQDYLGDLDYVRTVVKLARQYGPDDIKLFINDYNLESDWDQNRKLTSLIKWIERWEADGVTKIDGIGTQMHISCYADEATQTRKKEAIVNMFKLMKETGRLVRISELDMGYIDADGNTVMTVDMTEEQHHAMADLYKFVVSKYLEIIPKEQQWGICAWGVTDQPTNSYWRPGEPTGLWDLNYYRKHTYAGFADGLAGK